MLRSLTNESSGSELDTLKFGMMDSDSLSRTGQQSNGARNLDTPNLR